MLLRGSQPTIERVLFAIRSLQLFEPPQTDSPDIKSASSQPRPDPTLNGFAVPDIIDLDDHKDLLATASDADARYSPTFRAMRPPEKRC